MQINLYNTELIEGLMESYREEQIGMYQRWIENGHNDAYAELIEEHENATTEELLKRFLIHKLSDYELTLNKQ